MDTKGMGESFSRGLEVFAGWLPQLIGAILILVIGYFLAKAVQSAVGRLLNVAGFDRRLAQAPGGNYVVNVIDRPGSFVGSLAFWLIYLGALSLAATTLGIEQLNNFISAIYAYLPNVLAALLIFLVAAAISGAIATIATRVLGDSPTGRIFATVLPSLTMVIAVFMILNQLQIAKEIVLITYAGLIATMTLAIGLSAGLGGRQVASDLLGQAYAQSQKGVRRAKQDVDAARQ